MVSILIFDHCQHYYIKSKFLEKQRDPKRNKSVPTAPISFFLTIILLSNSWEITSYEFHKKLFELAFLKVQF